MGCASSKVDNEEKVARCKARKRFMKHAVASRHNFAASHAAYMQALKNVGAAFRQFGETELRDSTTTTACSASPPTPDAKTPPRQLFLPPPSPPRSISDGSVAKAGSSPETEGFSPESSPKKPQTKQKKGHFQPPPPPLPLGSAPPPPPPIKTSAWEFLNPFHTNEAIVPVVNDAHQPERRRIMGKLWFPPAESAAQEEQGMILSNEKMDDAAMSNSLAIVVPTQRSSNGRKELVDVLRELDELFLKAYESGKDAGKLLEARKIHYQSNFVESKGHDSHSSRVLNAISWGHWPSLKSPMKSKTEDTIILDDTGIHSGTLDRLFVWEKKLYEEMRAAEAGRLEYEKKCTLLRHQDSKGDYNESIDKTRSQIKMIQSRIVVALEGVDTASSAIIKIRDEELYPQLLELQEGLTRMWADLYSVHERQYEVVSKMRPLDSLLGSVEATSNIHRLATSQLEAALDNWYSCLNKLVTSQRDYMRNLSGWVRLCVMPFEDLKESSYNKDSSALTSPTRVALPPVHDVCLEWHQALDRLPDKVALEAIKSFVAVTHKIVELQNEELRHRKKVEALTKELEKKLNFIQNYEKKHPASAESTVDHRHSSTDENEEIVHDILPPKSPLADRRIAVDLLRRRLDEEKEQVAKAVYDTRAMTLNSLHTGLPSVFQSIAGFAGVCSQAFQVLYYNAQTSNNNSYGSYSP